MDARKIVRHQSWDPPGAGYTLVLDEDVKKPTKQTNKQASMDL